MKGNALLSCTVALCLFSLSPVYASTNSPAPQSQSTQKPPAGIQDKLDDLIELLPELKRLQYQTATFHDSGDKQTASWSFLYSNDPSGSKKSHITASIRINAATGSLTGYDMRNPDWSTGSAPSEEKAKKVAASFADSVLFESYSIADEVLTGTAKTDSENLVGVVLYQKINGIPLEKKWATVWVNGEGNVVRFHSDRLELPKESAFPNQYKVITASAAKEAYGKQIELLPMYHNNEFLYMILHKSALNAVDGTPLANKLEYHSLGTKSINPHGSPLNISSAAEAKQLLMSSFGFEPGALEARQSDVKEDNQTVKVYSWGPGVSTDIRFAEVRVQAKTGLPLSIYLDRTQASPQSAPTKEDMQKSALAIAEQLLPSGVNEISLLERESLEIGKQTEFLMYRSKNGIMFADGYVRVSVNNVTGKVHYAEYKEVNATSALPDPASIIPADRAKQAYLDQLKLELFYTIPTDDEDTAYLIYAPVSKNEVVHATTGNVMSSPEDFLFP